MHWHTNADCLKCGALEKKMVRVGGLIFCHKCTKEEFVTIDPPRDEREVYKRWIQEYEKKLEVEDCV